MSVKYRILHNEVRDFYYIQKRVLMQDSYDSWYEWINIRNWFITRRFNSKFDAEKYIINININDSKKEDKIIQEYIL
jgi:hypothetical protein